MMRVGCWLLALALVFTAAADAASYPPGYRWRTLTTDHFYVHFHQGEEELAQRAAEIAEQVHDRITPLFEYEPAGRTDIVLTDHVDVANGSATPFPSNRIEIYVSAPGADPSSTIEHYDNWLNLVITHEYAHILHLDQVRGFWGGFRKIFGRHPLTFPNAFSPLWVTEGLATLVESEATDAGRLKSTFVDMVLRTAAIEGRFATAAQAGGVSPAWPGGSARYLYGAKFLAWLAQKEGADKIAEYVRDYSGNVVPFRVNASAEAVFGKELGDLWDEWSREQQREYQAQHATLEREGFSPRRAITRLGFETKYPELSPSGDRIAYVHDGPFEFPTIRVREIGSHRDSAKQRVNSASRLSWSPDGTLIAFSQLERFRTFSVLSDLYLWNVATGRVRRLTDGARLKDPAFTRDGGALVAVENRGGRNRLVEVSISDGQIRPIVAPADFTQFSEPSVSPDGGRIVVAEWRDGRIDIVAYDRSGGGRRNLTETLQRSINASPRFSRDGRYVVFSSDVTGISNIYRVPADGGEIERLTNVYGGAFFPTSGDGRTIYYSDYSSRGFDIAMTDAETSYAITPRTLVTSVMGDRARVGGSERARRVEPSSSEPYSPWRTAAPQWWFPIFEVGGGVSDEDGGDTAEEATYAIGAMTSGADVLGFHSYDVMLLLRGGDGVTSHVDYAATYSYDRWYPTLTVAAAGFSDDVPGVSIPGIDDYRERTDRVLGLAIVPFAKFRWQMYAAAGVVVDQVAADGDTGSSRDQLAAAGIFTGTLHGIRAGLAFDSANEFGYSISPENGITARFDIEQTGGDASLRQFRADVRGYRTIPYRRSPLGRHVIAVRGEIGTTSGDFVLQRDFRVGGTGLGDFGGIDVRTMPVRGYSTGALRGQQAAIASLEYRFPIYEIDRGPATFPLFFRRIFADVFYDTGSAWDDDAVMLPSVVRRESNAFDADRTISSVGAEISLDLVLAYAAPVRYRLGAALLLDGRDDGDVSFYAALGSSF